MLKKLRLLVWKNSLIRRRHWLLTITEIVIPIILFSLVAYGRSKISGLNKIHINESTYHDFSSQEELYSHLAVGELYFWYAPYTDFTEDIVKRVQEKLQIPGDAVRDFHSKDELFKHFEKNCSSLVAAVIFNQNGHQLSYDLAIYDKYFTWNTDKLFIPMVAQEEMRSSKYLYKGYAALQVAIDLSYMERYLNKDHREIIFSLQEFPDPPRIVDSGINQLFIYFLPLITLFSFIFLCPAVLQRVGEEKSSGTKEFMKMVGLNSSIIWTGWFIHALITNMFSIIAIVILMKVSFWGVPYPPIEHSDGTVLFVFLFLYCMAAITFCFLIATIFNTPSIATVIGILIWIFSYFVPQTYVSSHEQLLWICKIPFIFLPNMALYFGYSAISVYEMRETGIQWYNVFQPGSGDDNDVTMGNVFVMLIVDIIFFMLLTLYIENVKPGNYGIPKSYYFPFTNLKKLVQRWFSHRVTTMPEDILLKKTEEGERPCIQIYNLTKKFYNHVAVDNLNMDVNKNRITVLLGQNGAGKTTTMSILTGMINATSGNVIVNGKDIKEHSDELRGIIGLCPQHNLLFPDLTVKEHLLFFAMLKGVQDAESEAMRILETLGLVEKKHSMANTLSGGMKRKLCLGMALVGNSQILILDEPSSGMDPESRRKIWDLLLEYRKKATILITTHFMEEADVLGDYIAIMANGRMQCYGTPLQLKAKYNTGYHLSLLVDSKLHVNQITKIVQEFFPEANKIREIASEIGGESKTQYSVVYVLPLIKNGNYKDLIAALEEKQNDLQIKAINMDVTTLNDVFLRAKDAVDGEDPSDEGDIKSKVLQPVTGIQRIKNNFRGLLLKRCYFLKKKYYWFFPAIAVTFSIFLLAIWLAMANTDYDNGDCAPLNLTLGVYGKPKVYYGGQYSSDPLVKKIRGFYDSAVLNENGRPIFEENVSEGIIKEGEANIAFYKRHMVVAAEFNESSNNVVYVNSMFSPEALHAIPISINLAMNAVIKTLLNESFSITVRNNPLKPLYTEFTPTELSVVNVASVWLILIPISMFFFMSNFIVFPNTEVSTDFIQIQTIAGIKTYFYWFTNAVFDLILSVVPLVVMILLLCLLNWLKYNFKAFQKEDILTITTILFTYVAASLPFTYVLSYRKTITGGFTLLIMLGIFAGIIPTLIVVSMEFSHDSHYMKIAEILKPILIIICPQFALSYISVRFSKKYVDNFNWRYMDPNKKQHLCDTDPNPCCHGEKLTASCYKYQNYFENETLGIKYELLYMVATFAVYFLMLLFLNSKYFQKMVHFIKYPSSLCSEYRSIENEKNEPGSQNSLYVKNLTKTFGNQTVVKDLKFSIKKNKCFGLLGVNGAGKSTTFRMLTKYLFFDKGDITLGDNKSIKITESKYSEKIGYCPQEDCFNYFLSGRQLLRTMACLKGYPPSEVEDIVNFLLNSFDLIQYADKPCLEYSGGNKRKLSSCVAFLGSPLLILLDEPTSGVDPASRRKFWKILSSFKNNTDTAFLLCSHSMEECENLCDEIAIMKKGEISDQGSLLALKKKYQKGLKVTIKLKSEFANEELTNESNKVKSKKEITASTNDELSRMNTIKDEISSKLEADLKEDYAGTLTFQIRDTEKRLSAVFCALEELKKKYEEIEDCVVNQISLEDIFLSVADNSVEVESISA